MRPVCRRNARNARCFARGIVGRSVITSAGKSNAIVPRVFFAIYNNMTIASNNTTARVCARQAFLNGAFRVILYYHILLRDPLSLSAYGRK